VGGPACVTLCSVRATLLFEGMLGVFNLDTMVFTQSPEMPLRRDEFAVFALDTRRILVVGGHNSGENADFSDILDVTL
jgi:hypothetical protein